MAEHIFKILQWEYIMHKYLTSNTLEWVKSMLLRRYQDSKSNISLETNPLSANFTKWSNTLKQLNVFDHFMGLALSGLIFKHFYFMLGILAL